MYLQDHHKIALVQGDEHISFATLIDRTTALSRALRVEAGQRVVIFAENRPEWVMAFFATWARGGVNVTIDMFSPADELAYIIKDCTPSLVVSSARNLAVATEAIQLSGHDCALLNLDEADSLVPPAGSPSLDGPAPDHAFANDELAMLLYTSGTTGSAKGVMLSWQNIWTNVRWINDSRRVNISDRMLAVLPFHHSWPLISTMLCPMDCGGTIVFLKTLNGEELVRAMKLNRITMVLAVPRLFEILHKGLMAKIRANKIAGHLFRIMGVLHWQPLCRLVFGAVHREFGGAIKVFISGGAKLDEAVIRDFRTLGITLVEGYGLTEMAPMVTYHPFEDQHIGSVGKIYDEIEHQTTEEGELLLRGPNLMLGYWGRPAETAEVVKDGWLHTGDLIRLERNGYLYITGRKKDIIVLTNGKNIRPDLIEAEILRAFPLVKEIAVTEKHDRLFAIVKPDMDHARQHRITNLAESVKWNVIDLYNKLAKNYNRIHDFMITTEDLPRTRMGKLKRFLLPAFIHKPIVAKQEESELLSEEFHLIAANIAFQTDRKVHSSDHLEMDLGMDSLALTELQVFIEKSFGVVLQPGWPNQFPMVKDLAAHVAEIKTRMEAQAFDWGSILREVTTPMPIGSGWLIRVVHSIWRMLFAGRLRLRSSGADTLPKGACIIVPNHQSYFDTLFLLGGLSRRVGASLSFLAKQKYFNSSLTRRLARHANIIVLDINRNIVDSVQQIAAALRSGRKVVIFPEGTRTRTGKMAAFKKTFAVISAEMGVPVVPVAIHGAWEVLPAHRFLPRRGLVSVDFLPAIWPQGKSEQEICQAAQENIALSLQS